MKPANICFFLEFKRSWVRQMSPHARLLLVLTRPPTLPEKSVQLPLRQRCVVSSVARTRALGKLPDVNPPTCVEVFDLTAILFFTFKENTHCCLSTPFSSSPLR